jgi:hypothetical protein
MKWDTTEILLERRYVGADPDTATLACRSVSELPEEYYTDVIGADGSVMRSVKARRSLLVRGITARSLGAVRFEPTDLSFKDSRTGKLETFRVEWQNVLESGTARFDVLSQA